MKVLNGTTHEITFYAEADTMPNPKPGSRNLVLKEGAQPICIVPPGDKALNANLSNAEPPEGDWEFPVAGAVKFDSVDPKPEGWDCIIVSNLYRSALIEHGVSTHNIGTVNGSVFAYPDAQRPCGVLRIAIG